MKTLLAKAGSVAGATVAIAIALILAGLGITAMVYLALFALAVLGLGILAAPFVALARRNIDDGVGSMERAANATAET